MANHGCYFKECLWKWPFFLFFRPLMAACCGLLKNALKVILVWIIPQLNISHQLHVFIQSDLKDPSPASPYLSKYCHFLLQKHQDGGRALCFSILFLVTQCNLCFSQPFISLCLFPAHIYQMIIQTYSNKALSFSHLHVSVGRKWHKKKWPFIAFL